jgi:hypothetical protein
VTGARQSPFQARVERARALCAPGTVPWSDAKLDLEAPKEDHRRVLTVIRFLDAR